MPPKKGKKEKQKKKKPSIPLDEVDTTVLNRQKLEEFCVEVFEALVKERQHSGFLRLDRDKLAAMVAISREQLLEAKDAILKRQHDLQDAEDRHRVDMWENRQKLIFLEIENNTNTLNSKLESVKKISDEELNHEKRMDQIISDIDELNGEIKSLEYTFNDIKIQEQINHAENKSQIRQEDKEKHLLKESTRDKQTNNKIKELEAKFNKDYKNLEQRKAKEIARLLKSNLKFCTDLKHYYNQVVNHNLSVTNLMKTEYQKLKAQTAAVEKQCAELKKENIFLVSSLNQSKTEESHLQKKLASSKKDQTQLKSVRKNLEDNKVLLENTKIEIDVLHMRVNKREDLKLEKMKTENEKIMMKKTKAEEAILILEMLVMHLYHRNKEADATLDKIKSIYLEKNKNRSVLDMIPSYQNTFMDEMNYQISAVADEREMILKAYKKLLQKYHLHMDDTGFTPKSVEDILKTAVSLRVLVDEDFDNQQI